MMIRISRPPRFARILPAVLFGLALAGCNEPERAAPLDVQLSLLDGSKPMLSSYRGKIVLGTFWSVSCSVCAEEIPHLNALHKQRDKYGLVVIGFNMPYDRPDWAVSFVKERSIQYSVSFDIKGEIARTFGGVQATPTTVLIDRQGNIVWKHVGRTDFNKLEAELAAMANG